MAQIINLTPHSICIVNPACVRFDTTIRKNVCDGEPDIVAMILSSGIVSAKINTVSIDPINGVPTFAKSVVGCDDLPDADEDDIFVVSALYVSAYRTVHGNTNRLYTIADPVYTPDGKKVIGSMGICPAF